jgi:outer membrane protein TolC
LRQTTIDLKTELAGVWSRLATSHADVLALRNDTLPSAAAAMREALRAYQSGGYSLTDVFAVRRSWAEWQLAYVDALARHHIAAADLAALLGTDLPQEARR